MSLRRAAFYGAARGVTYIDARTVVVATGAHLKLYTLQPGKRKKNGTSGWRLIDEKQVCSEARTVFLLNDLDFAVVIAACVGGFRYFKISPAPLRHYAEHNEILEPSADRKKRNSEASIHSDVATTLDPGLKPIGEFLRTDAIPLAAASGSQLTSTCRLGCVVLSDNSVLITAIDVALNTVQLLGRCVHPRGGLLYSAAVRFENGANPDILVAAGTIGGEVLLWRTFFPTRLGKLEKAKTSGLPVAPTAGSAAPAAPAASRIFGLKDLDTDAFVASSSGDQVASKHRGSVFAAAFSGDYLVTASDDRELHIHKVDTKGRFDLIAIGAGHLSRICEDGFLKLWDLHTGHCVNSVRVHHGRGIQALSCSPSGNIITGGEDGAVKLWRLKDLLHEKQFCKGAAINDRAQEVVKEIECGTSIDCGTRPNDAKEGGGNKNELAEREISSLSITATTGVGNDFLRGVQLTGKGAFFLSNAGFIGHTTEYNGGILRCKWLKRLPASSCTCFAVGAAGRLIVVGNANGSCYFVYLGNLNAGGSDQDTVERISVFKNCRVSRIFSETITDDYSGEECKYKEFVAVTNHLGSVSTFVVTVNAVTNFIMVDKGPELTASPKAKDKRFFSAFFSSMGGHGAACASQFGERYLWMVLGNASGELHSWWLILDGGDATPAAAAAYCSAQIHEPARKIHFIGADHQDDEDFCWEGRPGEKLCAGNGPLVLRLKTCGSDATVRTVCVEYHRGTAAPIGNMRVESTERFPTTKVVYQRLSESLLGCFDAADFVLWDTQLNAERWRFRCGDWKRPLSIAINECCGDESRGNFECKIAWGNGGDLHFASKSFATISSEEDASSGVCIVAAGHGRNVLSTTFLSCERFVTCGEDNTVRVWKVQQPDKEELRAALIPIRTFTDSPAPVRCSAASAHFFVSGSARNYVNIYEITGRGGSKQSLRHLFRTQLPAESDDRIQAVALHEGYGDRKSAMIIIGTSSGCIFQMLFEQYVGYGADRGQQDSSIKLLLKLESAVLCCTMQYFELSTNKNLILAVGCSRGSISVFESTPLECYIPNSSLPSWRTLQHYAAHQVATEDIVLVSADVTKSPCTTAFQGERPQIRCAPQGFHPRYTASPFLKRRAAQLPPGACLTLPNKAVQGDIPFLVISCGDDNSLAVAQFSERQLTKLRRMEQAHTSSIRGLCLWAETGIVFTVGWDRLLRGRPIDSLLDECTDKTVYQTNISVPDVSK